MLAVALMMDEGESKLVLVAMPMTLFIYNVIAYYICSDPNLFVRYRFWPTYVARGLDLMAITFLMYRLGSSENMVYLMYGTLIVGTGFVYGARMALSICAAAMILFYAVYSHTEAQFESMFAGTAKLALFPISVLVGTYLSKEFEQEWNRRESYKRLEGIYQLGLSFNERPDTHKILQKTIETALELTYADRCLMTIYVPNSQEIDRQVEMIRPGAEKRRPEESHTIVTEFQSHVQASSTPSEVDPETAFLMLPTARIETPLSIGSKIVGKLEVESWDPEIRLGENEAQLLSILASQTAVAIQNARMVEELQIQAETDPLTGLLNRRMLSQRIAYETKMAADKSYPLTIWIFDLDNFKSINDNYGHLVGDKVLQEVGRQLPKTIREGDLAIRYGGDEFLIVLRNVDIQDALAVVGRIKRKLESHPIDTGEGSPVSVKLSGGIASTSVDGFDSSELVHRADDRLLRAKHCGKNRIYGPENDSESRVSKSSSP